mmetsp:Transcript_21894/g.16217  ORF Transcript_21894/g.16217 Transcript_21894/m.16217 type:complete len:139 (+) Transcript_21894:359-775(+)
MWLNENKMIAYKHPFENNREVDLMYFDGYLIVASNYNFKIVPISPSEVNSTIDKFISQEDALAPTIEREAYGNISHDKIVGLIQSPNSRDLIFACQNDDSSQLIFYQFVSSPQEKRQVQLKTLTFDPSMVKRSRLDKK